MSSSNDLGQFICTCKSVPSDMTLCHHLKALDGIQTCKHVLFHVVIHPLDGNARQFDCLFICVTFKTKFRSHEIVFHPVDGGKEPFLTAAFKTRFRSHEIVSHPVDGGKEPFLTAEAMANWGGAWMELIVTLVGMGSGVPTKEALIIMTLFASQCILWNHC